MQSLSLKNYEPEKKNKKTKVIHQGAETLKLFDEKRPCNCWLKVGRCYCEK